MPMEDTGLLREYARTGEEAAFATLVERHIGLVYSAAYRQLQDTQLAEDTTQAVFLLLAKKAGQLAHHPGLSGWLLKTTRYVANSHIRATQRRRQREQEAAMQTELNDSSPSTWAQLEPHLDEAMEALGETDRSVLALRYFENKSAAEIGQTLKLSEEAAKKRANRALEKLRKFFENKGITLSAGAIAVTLSANSVRAVPVGLAAKITSGVFKYAFAASPGVFIVSKFITRVLIVSGSVALLMVGIMAYFRSVQHLPSTPPAVLPQGNVPASVAAQPNQTHSLASVQAAENEKLQTAINHLWLVLHTNPTNQLTTSAWDCDYPGITNAINEFGYYRMEAFNILLECSSDPQAFVREGSVYGLGYLGKNLPTAAPVLWNLSDSGATQEISEAFSALQTIGFGTWDLPALTSLLASEDKIKGGILNRMVPAAIATLLEQNPQSTASYIPELEQLLANTNSAVQLRAALALLNYEGQRNPAIFPPIHALFALTNNPQNQYLKFLATPILGDAGGAAKPLVPDLLRFAKQATELAVQADAFDAVAKIDPNLATQNPEIATALEKQEKARAWLDLWKSKSYTFEDLRAALHDPAQAYTAAEILANMGADASSAVPEMLKATWWLDEYGRNEMVDYVHKIDPTVVINKIILTNGIIPGDIAAYTFLEKQPPTQANQELKETIQNVDGSYGWMFQEEWTAYTNKLATLNLGAYHAFAKAMNKIKTVK